MSDVSGSPDTFFCFFVLFLCKTTMQFKLDCFMSRIEYLRGIEYLQSEYNSIGKD